MLLKIVENGDHFRDVVIQEGETFLVPGTMPECLLASRMWQLCLSESDFYRKHPSLSNSIQRHDWARDGTHSTPAQHGSYPVVLL